MEDIVSDGREGEFEREEAKGKRTSFAPRQLVMS